MSYMINHTTKTILHSNRNITNRNANSKRNIETSHACVRACVSTAPVGTTCTGQGCT